MLFGGAFSLLTGSFVSDTAILVPGQGIPALLLHGYDWAHVSTFRGLNMEVTLHLRAVPVLLPFWMVPIAWMFTPVVLGRLTSYLPCVALPLGLFFSRAPGEDHAASSHFVSCCFAFR